MRLGQRAIWLLAGAELIAGSGWVAASAPAGELGARAAASAERAPAPAGPGHSRPQPPSRSARAAASPSSRRAAAAAPYQHTSAGLAAPRHGVTPSRRAGGRAGGAPPPELDPGANPSVAGSSTGSASGAQASGPPAHAPAPTASVSCQTDLPLAQSPRQPYNFLCSQNGIPLSWPSDRIVMYMSGLSVLQQAAFTAAVAQWEAVGRFDVSYTSSAASADVTVQGEPLGPDGTGFTEDGYTTVAYRCATSCVYDHARVVLSSTATLTPAGWTSTILHELGHVAGLNHVSYPGEVMYPVLESMPLTMYSSGDQAGLAVLAGGRNP